MKIPQVAVMKTQCSQRNKLILKNNNNNNSQLRGQKKGESMGDCFLQEGHSRQKEQSDEVLEVGACLARSPGAGVDRQSRGLCQKRCGGRGGGWIPVGLKAMVKILVLNEKLLKDFEHEGRDLDSDELKSDYPLT